VRCPWEIKPGVNARVERGEVFSGSVTQWRKDDISYATYAAKTFSSANISRGASKNLSGA
jgi:hypothetical protein